MSSIPGQHRRRWWLSAALLLAFLPVTAAAQLLPKIPQIQPFGIDGFRLMLQQRGLQATVDRVGTALNEKPEETVAVVLGDLKTVTEGGGIQTDGQGIQKQLERFVENGGNLLVASDLHGQRVKRAQICGTWVRELRRWLTKGDMKNAYHNFADCPVVTSFDREAEPDLFSEVERLVANRPSAIDGSDKSAAVAWLPMRRSPPLMSVQRRGSGKMLFIADHSLFVNEMLVHADNAQFANNVTHWLADSESRTRLVLISDGNVLPNWTFGESPPSIPLSSLLRAAKYGSLADLPLGDSLLPFLNESISRSQQENEFNAALSGAARVLARRRGLRLGVLIATLLITISFVAWLISLRATPRRWLAFQDWHQPRRRIRPASR